MALDGVNRPLLAPGLVLLAGSDTLPGCSCCSRAFQKFAIRSSTLAEEAAKKTAQSKQQLGEHGSEFFKVFRDEVRVWLKLGFGIAASTQQC